MCSFSGLHPYCRLPLFTEGLFSATYVITIMCIKQLVKYYWCDQCESCDCYTAFCLYGVFYCVCSCFLFIGCASSVLYFLKHRVVRLPGVCTVCLFDLCLFGFYAAICFLDSGVFCFVPVDSEYAIHSLCNKCAHVCFIDMPMLHCVHLA